MPSYHCLRPEFTEYLVSKLLLGNVINLISPHGQGRRRTLSDLLSLLTKHILILQANLRNYPKNVLELTNDLSTQLGQSSLSNIGSLLDHLERNGQQTLIILHNFDELQSGDDTGYNEPFFKHLNNINARASISLLCVSEKVSGSPLQIESLQLPALTSSQLLEELSHRNLDLTQSELTQLAYKLSIESSPYTELETWYRSTIKRHRVQ
jgi:hypothetical protein